MARWIALAIFLFVLPFSVLAGQNCDGRGKRQICLIPAKSDYSFLAPFAMGFDAWKAIQRMTESKFDLSSVVPVSYQHVHKLLDKGLSLEEIAQIGSAVERHRDTYAYQQFRKPISIPDLYYLSLYASTIVGGGVDPWIYVGTHWVEMIKKMGVGGCAFVSDKNESNALVRGWNSGESERFQKQFQKERAAFQGIYQSINAYLRKPRYRIQQHYLLASCGAGALGPFQVMPSLWVKYEPEVCGEICEALGVEYASPYHLIPAIFGAAAILRDTAIYMRIEPEDVNMDEPEIAQLVSAAYYAGPRAAHRFIGEYGAVVFKRAQRAMALSSIPVVQR